MTFVNYNKDVANPDDENAVAENFYALQTCSHCESSNSHDSGARTVKIEDISYENTTSYVNFNYPRRAILRDLDGSFSG